MATGNYVEEGISDPLLSRQPKEDDMKKITCIKLARPNGWDFYSGTTINYREHIGKTVLCPNGNAKLGICTRGVIHASVKPNDCFVGTSIPCSAYRVEGKPVCGDKKKYGFLDLTILEEIPDLDKLFGWNYTEACNPIIPLKGKAKKPTQIELDLLKQWASVRDSVWASVWDSVGDSVGASVGDSAWASVGDSAWASVRDSVWASARASARASVWASVWASVGAYIGSLFPNIEKWTCVDHKKGSYPFQAAVDLWKRGFVPSFDGQTWRLHSGKSAKIVCELS